MSRLSTAFHAAAITLLPSAVGHSAVDHKPHPSARVVMTTLLVVGFPIQLVFLAFIYMFGWIHLPFVFVVFEVLFYLLAVCTISLPPLHTYSRPVSPVGRRRFGAREGHHRVLLEMEPGPRHVRPADPLSVDGRRGSVLACGLLRGCLAPGRESAVNQSIVRSPHHSCAAQHYVVYYMQYLYHDVIAKHCPIVQPHCKSTDTVQQHQQDAPHTSLRGNRTKTMQLTIAATTGTTQLRMCAYSSLRK